jgi:hypothetical protein
MTNIKFGDRVLVPRHFKPRGTDRVYDGGVVTELHKGVATIKLDDGRTVHTAVGLLSHVPATDLPTEIADTKGRA